MPRPKNGYTNAAGQPIPEPASQDSLPDMIRAINARRRRLTP